MQSTSPRKKRLGQAGIHYISEQLADAAPLSESLIRYLASGYAWEFVIEGQLQLSAAEQADLRAGGIGSETAQGEYIDFLCEVLNEEPSNIVLFENQLFKLTDPVMLGKVGRFEWQGATYSYLQGDGNPVSKQAVTDHLLGASRYPSVIIATRMSKSLYIDLPRSLTLEEAMELETGVRHILVGAHDEEAYVGWSREK
jgi:hypothetical protein